METLRTLSCRGLGCRLQTGASRHPCRYKVTKAVPATAAGYVTAALGAAGSDAQLVVLAADCLMRRHALLVVLYEEACTAVAHVLVAACCAASWL
jgi:hypothetical protein